MLIELYAVMIAAVPLILGCVAFSHKIDKRMDLELKMHKAVYATFFTGKCVEPVECSSSKIAIDDLYEIKIRKPSKPFDAKNKEDNRDEVFGKLYGELEKAVKNSPK